MFAYDGCLPDEANNLPSTSTMLCVLVAILISIRIILHSWHANKASDQELASMEEDLFENMPALIDVITA